MPRQRLITKSRSAAQSEHRRLILRVTLRYIEPAIWREISVPDAYSLAQLHRCIQLSFDWLDYHLFLFEVAGRQFARAEPDALGEDAAAVRLADLPLKARSAFLYVYDMGDGWEHDIEVRSTEAISLADPDHLAYVLDGARAGPPEDVGGPPGYDHLIQALRSRRTVDDEDLIASAGPDFDPERFDRRAVNHGLVLASAWGVI
jgi:hypothetical protein